MKKNIRKLIVVLGMHRSGTSAITRGLQVLGAELGNRLIPPIIGNNDTGFWEDIDINAFNTEMLNSLNMDWHSLTPIQPLDINILREHGYLQQALELLQQKTTDAQVFGFKDPRTTKLLQFWKEVFAMGQINVSYVISIRNPLSVCASLTKRDGFEPEKSYLLWLEHVITGLAETAGEKRVLIDYDLLIQAPETELTKIAKELQLRINLPELEKFKAEFLDKGLQHTVYQLKDLISDNEVPPLIKEVYSDLWKVATNRQKLDTAIFKNKIKRWSSEFSRQKSALVLANKLVTKIVALNGEKELVLQEKELVLQEKELVLQELKEIKSGAKWEIFQLLIRIRLAVLPVGSRRERMAQGILRGLRILHLQGALVFISKGILAARLSFNRSIYSILHLFSRTQPLENNSVGNYVPLTNENIDAENFPVKVIAFYLPQFHPIPENDMWWGKGFTEWTNVSKATPNFVGHYQPHLPGELGFYDLRLPDVQKRQVELAKKYGIYGFCFYYYWFAGKRLLEYPLDQYVANPSLDLPFCLCWANENWTRRWDGAEHEILIEQVHTEDEYLHFIHDIMPNFRDQRYIRMEGKPVLIVYRASLLHNPKKAAEIWRSECRKAGLGEIYLIVAQSFDITNPHPYGFDAAVEFPPHGAGDSVISQNVVKMINPKFRGYIYDYRLAAHNMMQKKPIDYTLFKTVMVAWDNTARKQNHSNIFINSSPSAYQEWLINAAYYSQEHLPKDKQFVFVNAWNEWAEGTHLEPDQKYGYAYLQATTSALKTIKKSE